MFLYPLNATNHDTAEFIQRSSNKQNKFSIEKYYVIKQLLILRLIQLPGCHFAVQYAYSTQRFLL